MTSNLKSNFLYFSVFFSPFLLKSRLGLFWEYLRKFCNFQIKTENGPLSTKSINYGANQCPGYRLAVATLVNSCFINVLQANKKIEWCITPFQHF